MRHQVRRQNEDALVILELAQKDGNESVPLNARIISLSKEDICFVEQHDSFPPLSEFQDLCEPLFDMIRVSS